MTLVSVGIFVVNSFSTASTSSFFIDCASVFRKIEFVGSEDRSMSSSKQHLEKDSMM